MTLAKSLAPRYLLSCALSLLGNSVAGVIMPLVLLATKGDALAAGTLALICAVPQMVIGLVGGALIDRFNRRNISILSDIMSAVSVALIPVVDMVWGLSFGWFVALGLLGAVGDIPGMTARDALLPAVTERDGRSLQKFMGLTQSLDSLVVIVGPALAALLLANAGNVNALWFTAAISFCAALITLTMPQSIGHVGAVDAEEDTTINVVAAPNSVAEAAVTPAPQSLIAGALTALSTGVRILFKDDALLRSSMLLTFGITMIMGSFQGLVLPVHFTNAAAPELLGYTLSALSAGMLVSSLTYSAVAHKLKRRTWFVLSLVGMAAGLTIIGLMPGFPVLLGGALLMGVSAGPASALLGFFAFDRIPEANRGSALGTQNALMLVAAPVAMFASSIVVEVFGEANAGLVLAGCWVAVTLWALCTPSLKALGDEIESTTTPISASHDKIRSSNN